MVSMYVDHSSFPQAVLSLDVLLHVPVQLVLPGIELLVLVLPDLLHLLIIVKMPFVVRRFLLAQVDIQDVTHVIFLDMVYYLLLLEYLVTCLRESEIRCAACFLCLHDCI